MPIPEIVRSQDLRMMKSLSNQFVNIRLYLGRNINNVKNVKNNDFKQFQKKIIGKKLNGWTVINSKGSYFQNGKYINEKTYILEYSCINDEKELDKMRDIASCYAKMFKQDSVLLTSTPIIFSQFIKVKE